MQIILTEVEASEDCLTEVKAFLRPLKTSNCGERSAVMVSWKRTLKMGAESGEDSKEEVPAVTDQDSEGSAAAHNGLKFLRDDACCSLKSSLNHGDGRPATFASAASVIAFAELCKLAELLHASLGREKTSADDSVRCNTHFLPATMLLGEAAATARGATIIIGEPAINVPERTTTSVCA